MTTPTIIVLALVVPLTIIGGVVFLWRVSRRLRTAYTTVLGSYERLEPSLRQLQQDAEVTRRELDELGVALEQLAANRGQPRHGA